MTLDELKAATEAIANGHEDLATVTAQLTIIQDGLTDEIAKSTQAQAERDKAVAEADRLRAQNLELFLRQTPTSGADNAGTNPDNPDPTHITYEQLFAEGSE